MSDIFIVSVAASITLWAVWTRICAPPATRYQLLLPPLYLFCASHVIGFSCPSRYDNWQPIEENQAGRRVLLMMIKPLPIFFI